MSHDKCHACGGNGYFAECKYIKPDTEPVKVVHNEVKGLVAVNQDPALSMTRRRGWYLSTKCNVHVCNSRDMFAEYCQWSNHEVILDTGEHVDVAGVGIVLLRLSTGEILPLRNVFHIPAITKCRVSISKLTDMGYKVVLSADGATIEKNHEIVGRGEIEDGLYRLSINTKPVRAVHNEVTGLVDINQDPVLEPKRRRGWYLDTKCNVHVCNSRDMFGEYRQWSNHELILDNNDRADVAGIGTVELQLATGKVLTLSNVYHIPTMKKCLVSIRKLTEIGFQVFLTSGGPIVERNHKIVGKGYVEDGLYRLSVMEEDAIGISELLYYFNTFTT